MGIQSVFHHVGIQPNRMTDPHGHRLLMNTSFYEQIHGSIARRRQQEAFSALNSALDESEQRGGFARARWSVQDGQLLSRLCHGHPSALTGV